MRREQWAMSINGDWGSGTGDWGLGTKALLVFITIRLITTLFSLFSPVPSPQSPIKELDKNKNNSHDYLSG